MMKQYEIIRRAQNAEKIHKAMREKFPRENGLSSRVLAEQRPATIAQRLRAVLKNICGEAS